MIPSQGFARIASPRGPLADVLTVVFEGDVMNAQVERLPRFAFRYHIGTK
jgi:hypothetical protein